MDLKLVYSTRLVLLKLTKLWLAATIHVHMFQTFEAVFEVNLSFKHEQNRAEFSIPSFSHISVRHFCSGNDGTVDF